MSTCLSIDESVESESPRTSENPSKKISQSFATRKYSASNESQASTPTVVGGRKFSLAASSVSSTRKSSVAFSNYVSPYSKNFNLETTTKLPKETTVVSEQYENTYRLEPGSLFPVGKVREIIRKTLENAVSDVVYSQLNCGHMSRLLSQLIKDQVKGLSIERYKVVCVVTIGSKRTQGMRVASRCLWDDEFDRFATATVENKSLFAVGTVYGVYMH